jgi:hypothetical protein
MTEQPKFSKRPLLVGVMAQAGLVLSGCLGRPAEPQGASIDPGVRGFEFNARAASGF